MSYPPDLYELVPREQCLKIAHKAIIISYFEKKKEHILNTFLESLQEENTEDLSTKYYQDIENIYEQKESIDYDNLAYPSDCYNYITDTEAKETARKAIIDVYYDLERAKIRQAYDLKLENANIYPNFNIIDEYREFIKSEGLAKSQRECWKRNFTIPPHLHELFQELTAYFGGFPQHCKKIKEHHKTILIIGPVGTGKTEILKLFTSNPVASFLPKDALAINNQARTKDKLDSTILQYSNLINSKDVGGSQSYFGQKEIGLMIDDIGTENELNSYGNKVEVIAEILLNRYTNLKAINRITTILLTNLNTKELGEKYGTRIFDRLKEQSCNFIIPKTTSLRG